MFSSRIKFAYEHPRRLRVAVVGCGGQAYRNILPCFQYAPVELVAVCDAIPERAEAYARQFGAAEVYQDLTALLESADVDAVLLATGYDEDGRPRYPEQAKQVLRSGRHAWIEKPPAASSAELAELHRESTVAGRQVGVGLMKMFSTSVNRVAQIISQPEFGAPTTLYLRDPEKLPPAAERNNLDSMHWFLDHIVHPASVLQRLMGPVRRLYTEEGPDGEPIFTIKFQNGAAGVLHMPWGMSGNSPMERLEVVGQGANVVVENNTRITYYRPGHRGVGDYEYGRIPDFTSELDVAPLHWEMDSYSGQPYNLNLFVQGYAQEIIYFATQLLAGKDIEIAGLRDAWHVMRFYEACAQASNQVVEFTETFESAVERSAP
ncbi:Gfo/Idh/MocA family oxidoreductase [Catellatospora sp. NPDC049609]|uniref:Gfo/Idh/MocA family protein n=1 Tax=Catellatospora sp. NPDC049609 TaxID=3155505 RepID=UPI003418ACCA